MGDRVVQVRRLATGADLERHLSSLGVQLPVAPSAASLGQPLHRAGVDLSNRFAVLPMEGWDGTPDGRPTDLVIRRWARFGASGAGTASRVGRVSVRRAPIPMGQPNPFRWGDTDVGARPPPPPPGG